MPFAISPTDLMARKKLLLDFLAIASWSARSDSPPRKQADQQPHPPEGQSRPSRKKTGQAFRQEAVAIVPQTIKPTWLDVIRLVGWNFDTIVSSTRSEVDADRTDSPLIPASPLAHVLDACCLSIVCWNDQFVGQTLKKRKSPDVQMLIPCGGLGLLRASRRGL